jgi:hypothetical protein
VALQFSAVIIFSALYNFLDVGCITSNSVLMSVVATSLAGYVVFTFGVRLVSIQSIQKILYMNQFRP